VAQSPLTAPFFFVLDSAALLPKNWAVRTCVIFNPSAKGEKARHFRRHLDAIATQSALKLTTCPGDAQRLAAKAVSEGFDTIVAAGGDGTLNEVLNGIGDAPRGVDRARLAVLPLGTVNVFAREVAIPLDPVQAWEIIQRGRELRIDLPSVQYAANGANRRRYFAQLAGAGLDARAIELVRWELKEKNGSLAYVIAGLQALLSSPSKITAAGSQTLEGGLVLVGNGRLYGGRFQIFPDAHLQDGQLEVCVFPRVNWLTLARCGLPLLVSARVPAAVTRTFRTSSLVLNSPLPTPFEVDGELIGRLPATFSIAPSRLRVIVP
jgi:diacylglycerol kinase (ATP)